MNNRKFIRTFIIIFFGILLCIVTANFVIDPYGFHYNFRYEGFNKNKPAFSAYSRIVKLYNAKDVKPNALFLGNSRLLYLVPEEAFSKYEPYTYYNFAFSGATLNEMNDVLAYSIRNFDIESVCYGIDFIAFLSRSMRYPNTFDTALVKGQKSMCIEFAKMHTSYQSIEESYNCVISNRKDPKGRQVRWHYNQYGSRTNKWRELNYERLGDKWIDEEMKKVAENYNLIYNNREFVLPEYKKGVYQLILEQCKQHRIEYSAFINPLHKDQFISLLESSAYPLYIEYLEFLAKNGGFWYFGGLNEITSDKQYFWDTQHPRKRMSEVITEVMYSDISPSYTDKLFGTFVDSSNIDALVNELSNLRKDLKVQNNHEIQK